MKLLWNFLVYFILDWKPSCRPVPPNTTVELSFNIPDISVINKTSHDICVILDVPSDFLVQFSESKCISDFSITVQFVQRFVNINKS